MKNYLCKSLLGLSLILTVSCATDTESLDDTDLSTTSESLLSEPGSSSRVRPVKGSTYYIKNVKSQKYLDVEGVSKDEGANVHQWTFTGANNQKWKVVNFDGNTRLVSVHSGKSLDIEGFSTKDGGNAHQWTWTTNDNQQFTMIKVNGETDRFYIDNIKSSKLLGIESGKTGKGANVEQQDRTNKLEKQWEFFKVN